LRSTPANDPATIDDASAGTRDGTAAARNTSVISAMTGQLNASANPHANATSSPRGPLTRRATRAHTADVRRRAGPRPSRSSTSARSCPASVASGARGAPIRTSIGAGRTRPCLGSTSRVPSTAAGTSATPQSAASRTAPEWNSPTSPSVLRVPSG
jgi:hypothetical protein